MTKTALILGATGRFGRNAAEAFAAAGWSVRNFDRRRDTLWDAAWGVDLIVNGWNPPYPQWQAELPGQIARIIEVAKASGATLLQPANVYVFGEGAPERLAEDTPHGATNPLGRVRVEMEAALRDAGMQVILLRAGDFIDTEASGNWFDRILTANLAKGRLTYPGPDDRPHAWAYLPDMARAAVDLAEKRQALAQFEEVPFPGYTLTGADLVQALQRVTGRVLRAERMSWLPLRMAQPFWPMAKHLIEMRYLWEMPHHLDGEKFARLLPEFQPTPLTDALASALDLHVHPDKAVA